MLPSLSGGLVLGRPFQKIHFFGGLLFHFVSWWRDLQLSCFCWGRPAGCRYVMSTHKKIFVAKAIYACSANKIAHQTKLQNKLTW